MKNRVKTTLGIMVVAIYMLSACVDRGSEAVQVEKKPAPPTPTRQSSNQEDKGTGELKTVFLQKDLQKFNLKTADLSYKFSYLDVNKSDKIIFKDGKAEISITGLTAEKSGTLTLDIYEGQTKQLTGSQDNVILKKGQNELSLTLKKVAGPITEESTDLVLDVVIAQDSTSTSTSTSTTTSTNTTTSDDWDGLSFRGNDEWEIVPIN